MNKDLKIATRQSFGEALKSLGDENENIVVLDADLAGATKTSIFKKAHPDRFFDIGIAENNMIGIASGFSTCGKIPFAASFAAFVTGRSYDQIRASVAYPNLNVKLCGTHSRSYSWRRWSYTSNVRRYKLNERTSKYESNFSIR